MTLVLPTAKAEPDAADSHERCTAQLSEPVAFTSGTLAEQEPRVAGRTMGDGQTIK